MNNNVLIVGSVALDNIKTPCGDHMDLLGGSAVYGSIAASLFAKVNIVGVTGDDFPQQHIELLRGRGVDLGGLERVAGGKTFRWTGEYHEEMNEAVTHQTELGVFAEFNPAIPAPYREDSFVFLANIDPELQLSVLEQVKKPKLTLCDSMNLWINIKRDALLQVLSRVDLVLLNESEIKMLFETSSLPVAAGKLLELGVERAIVKKGSYGAQMFSKDGTFAVPAIPLSTVVDPTGAGDTFAGGVIGFLASRQKLDEMTFRQAVLVGSACASFVVEKFSVGGTASLTREMVLARCARLHDAIHCHPVMFD